MAQLKDLIVTGPSRFAGSVMFNSAVGTLSGSNASVSPDHALLISGYNRSDDTSGDTWLYWDALGGTDAPWGIKHNQTENKIEFWGSGSASSYINLSSGVHYTQGIYDLRYGSSDYVPTTNGGVVHIPSMSVNYANSAGYASSAGSATDQTARDAAATAQSTANGKWTWNANDVAGVKVNNAGYADSAGSATYATNATYATYDSSGNYIVDRYATKSEIPSIPSSLPASGGTATNAYNDQNGNNIANTYATINWVSSNFNYSTDTWRPITDSYSGSEKGTSLSQYGANALYNALVNGYASEAGYAASAGSANSVAWSNVSGRPTSVSQFTNDSGYFNASNVWNNPTSATINTTIGPTEMYSSVQGFISNGTVVVKNGTLYVTDNPFMPTSTHWLDAYSDPNSFGGASYTGQITLDLYPDRFYDFTYTPLISGIKINSIPGWNTDGLISHNIVRFRPGMGGFTLTVPSGIYWANGAPTEFDNNSIYELSFIRRGTDSITATWTKFTQA